jgi:hypothetical protein
MADKILDNGTLLTLGLVGVVAAVGAFSKRGSRAQSWESYMRGREQAEVPETTCVHCHTPHSVPEYAMEDTPGWEGFCSWACKEAHHRAEEQREAAWARSHRGSRATLEERVADLQYDVGAMFAAGERRRPSEIRQIRERALAQNRDLLARIKEGQERGVDTRLLERDLRSRMR